MTKLAEIQQAIETLPPQEQAKLRHWFFEHMEETPEMLAFIDEGIRSAETEPLIPIEEVRKQIKGWATR
jgi:hypothetical protein